MDFMRLLKLDEAELRSRKAFYEITDEDLARLARLQPLVDKHGKQIVDALYELILGHTESRSFFPDELTVQRVKALQLRYLAGLFSGRCDLAYLEDRLRVGAAHERIGLQPKWYIGAYARYLRLLMDELFAELSAEDALAATRSVTKLISFDMSLALDTYIAAHIDTIARHQSALRELSTPVIRVYERILLLPLVGTVDSHRAQQIMETVLVRTVEEQAKAIIFDIAGVPVVDTKVADHLLKTTAAVRLLGAEAILTGIRAEVARTLVHLGVDVSSMHTHSRLGDGIEFALGLIGKSITTRAHE
jgi:rsbT co-antagonist protein RsbR